MPLLAPILPRRGTHRAQQERRDQQSSTELA
jgi:hypothetical protein